MIEKIKNLIAIVLDKMGILDYSFKCLNNGDKNYVRVVNYHDIHSQNMDLFKKQLLYFKQQYNYIDLKKFQDFKKGSIKFQDKPAILLTFDDGYENNFTVARELLNDLNVKGLFFVSSKKIGEYGYMDLSELLILLEEGHSIGCHTSTHHRMNKNDGYDLLKFEIIDSKIELERILRVKIDTFCWCGGELETYTNNAATIIRNNYEFSFMTNSQIVSSRTDNYQIQRSNIEDRWKLSLVKMQVCGLMDVVYSNKRKKVNSIVTGK